MAHDYNFQRHSFFQSSQHVQTTLVSKHLFQSIEGVMRRMNLEETTLENLEYLLSKEYR